jgi:hypothetical protein
MIVIGPASGGGERGGEERIRPEPTNRGRVIALGLRFRLKSGLGVRLRSGLGFGAEPNRRDPVLQLPAATDGAVVGRTHTLPLLVALVLVLVLVLGLGLVGLVLGVLGVALVWAVVAVSR